MSILYCIITWIIMNLQMLVFLQMISRYTSISYLRQQVNLVDETLTMSKHI